MTDTALPLSGLTVLDAATFIAGPSCAALLAEFGAEVIKVEHPEGGDPLRRLGTKTGKDASTLLWLNEGRGKRSLTLNLKDKRGAKLFRKLAAKADIICENFRPGTLERWGLGYDELSADNPGLILLRVSGFGQDGPYKDRPGFARIAHALSGLTHLTGEEGGPPLTPGSTSLADYMSGLYGVIGVLLALRHRDVTGNGQVIDVALYESVFRALDEIAPAHALTGLIRGRQGIGTVNACPHGHFPTKDGKWVAIACTADRMFARLAQVMGTPEIATPEAFQTVNARLDGQEQVDALVRGWCMQHDQSKIVALCEAGEVPCGPVLSIDDILKDPHYKARATLTEMEVPGVGRLPFPSPLPRLSASPGQLNHLGPDLGDANVDIYGRMLGLSKVEMSALKADGVI
ncbi:MAG: CoA transferase [Rhodobacteraceae bacterium]|nr:CoA transferase [Paracoccaceae bacterium]